MSSLARFCAPLDLPPAPVGRLRILLLVAAVWSCSSGRATGAAWPAGVPRPSTTRIDYAHPDKYLAIDSGVARAAVVDAVANDIPTGEPAAMLQAIGLWIDAHLVLRPDSSSNPYRWRDFDRMLSDGFYFGCADHAFFFGEVARAKGIPVVFVKTLDADFLREMGSTSGNPSSWRGHVFLEVYAEGSWKLLDASAKRMYGAYDPAIRILPGDRLAYDKGGDPYALIMSMRWDLWREQTRAFARTVAPASLPLTTSSPAALSIDGEVAYAAPSARRFPALSTVHAVISSDAEGHHLSARGASLGARLANLVGRHFAHWLPEAEGQWLVVDVIGGHTTLPEEYQAEYLPEPLGAIAARARAGSGRLDRTLDDGTHVVVIYAADEASLLRQLDQLVVP
jgi:hypothetical protein